MMQNVGRYPKIMKSAGLVQRELESLQKKLAYELNYALKNNISRGLLIQREMS